jgi:hypothetical protein
VRATSRPYPGAFVRQRDESTLRVWSGAPATGPSDGFTLQLADGYYTVHSWDLEGVAETHSKLGHGSGQNERVMTSLVPIADPPIHDIDAATVLVKRPYGDSPTRVGR